MLRLELAAAEGTAKLSSEVRQRLARIGRSRAFLDRRNRRDLVDDLEIHRKAIVHRIASQDPVEALDLMWQFMGLANSTLDRGQDSDETVIDVFHAVADLADIARAASPEPGKLDDRTFEALTQNGHGQYNDLIRVLTPALGQQGLERLKQRIIELSNMPVAQLPKTHRPRIRWQYLGTAYEDKIAEHLRLKTARSALQDIADVQGDVDAFIDQYEEDTRKKPFVAAGIARRPPRSLRRRKIDYYM